MVAHLRRDDQPSAESGNGYPHYITVTTHNGLLRSRVPCADLEYPAAAYFQHMLPNLSCHEPLAQLAARLPVWTAIAAVALERILCLT
jgi:hypothetical protein